MYRNTVYSENNIVDLEEYKSSSLHQKRQQEQLYKKHEKKKTNPKNQNKKKVPNYRTKNEYREYSSSLVMFIVAITLVGLICFGIAYCIKSVSPAIKAESAATILL